ncbi:hypothetical protein WISP_28251 [Willisornis vidua]|uniref:Uncharacterized protein n=1 Tax=Willisornis vidua TaxID=1566151 RepID=A0ABQ9DLN1_9PASS|nr:hypothetical protein WISP_28251 [Willisornis vidua]
MKGMEMHYFAKNRSASILQKLFKKRVGASEVPRAVIFPYTLTLHHHAFAASSTAVAATLVNSQLYKLGLDCFRSGSETLLVATCENHGFHGTRSNCERKQEEDPIVSWRVQCLNTKAGFAGLLGYSPN